MPTVSKQIAEELIERLKKQKRPKVYCVVSYQYEGEKENYVVCYGPRQYRRLRKCVIVVRVLWESKRCEEEIFRSVEPYCGRGDEGLARYVAARLGVPLSKVKSAIVVGPK